MAHLHLGPGPGESGLPLKDIYVVIFIGKAQSLLAGIGHTSGESESRGFSGLQNHSLSKTKDRIQYGSYSVRQWLVFHHCRGFSRTSTSAQESTPISLKLNSSN